ncbi:unnamed protein product [Miscanthus lutarioriparius]|uniref:Uncharacterized protein n=1 Tax=Miscanthus lutarioriparius TaxID=422564 RepID=A0A811MTA7_9POAL|nr:unnamed protein product [Miscanthus lutarioriparius]
MASSSSSALPLLSLLLALLLLSAPSPSASAELAFLTASSNGSASISADPELEDLAPEPTFLEEVIDAVSEKYDWDPDAEVRVWPLDADAVRVGAVQRYEFRARAGGSAALARFSDEAVQWRRPSAPAVEEVDGPDGVDVVPAEGAFGFDTGVRNVELVGPLELKLAGNEDGGLVELQLPSGNATYTRLKRIFVADGIALKVIGAQKVSVTHPHSIGLLSNGSLLTSNNDLSQIWPLSYSTCAPLLQVGVVGSVVIVVHQTSVSGGHVKTSLRSHDTIELLSDKCKVNIATRLISEFLFSSISPRLIKLEKILKTWFSKRNHENSSMHFIEAKVTSIPLVKFRLEFERDVTEDDPIWEDVPEWKTKPMVQRVPVDIIARVEDDDRLKAISVKKVRRQFPVVDTTTWGSLASNISFTKFLSFILPPEPLSLDVKW